MGWLVRALILRDLRLALRSGGGIGLGLGFYLILVVLMPLGLGPDVSVLAKIAPGILWIGALLSTLLSLDRIFALDYEDGSLDLLVTSPVPMEGVVLAKIAAHWLTTGLPLIILAPILAILLNLPIQGMSWLVFALAIGTPALSAIGAFGAALTVVLKRGNLILSLLVLPLSVPTLVFGAEVVRRGAMGLDTWPALAALAGITLGSVSVLPFATAAALRAILR
jgi:heme exporter protein B